jgi:hypothetical protein
VIELVPGLSIEEEDGCATVRASDRCFRRAVHQVAAARVLRGRNEALAERGRNGTRSKKGTERDRRRAVLTTIPLSAPRWMLSALRGWQTELIPIVECEDDVGPTSPRESPVRAACTLDGPTDPQERLQDSRGLRRRPASGWTQSRSRRVERDAVGKVPLAVRCLLCKHPKCERSCLHCCVVTALAVRRDFRKSRDVGYPPAVILLDLPLGRSGGLGKVLGLANQFALASSTSTG